MSIESEQLPRRDFLRASVLGVGAISSRNSMAQTAKGGASPMELQLDHVMFPVYFNNAFLEIIEGDFLFLHVNDKIVGLLHWIIKHGVIFHLLHGRIAFAAALS